MQPRRATVKSLGLVLTVAHPGLQGANMSNIFQGFHPWLGTVAPPGMQNVCIPILTLHRQPRSQKNLVEDLSGHVGQAKAAPVVVIGEPLVIEAEKVKDCCVDVIDMNLVNGGRDVVNALCDHPQVRAISFVGSTPVAKHVYTRSAASGKRMQCQGGAKNHVIVLPDADMELATQIISDSAFGCAGQRCLAVSVAVTIGEAQKTFRDSIAHAASAIRVGNGLDAGIQMGPVITKESKQRIESLISAGVGEGAKPIVDGRNTKIPKYESGNFLTPTVLDGLPSTSQLANTEIFGPVLSLVHANSIEEAMEFLRRSPYGNQASLFTTSGSAARKFRYEAPAGNIGINIGVAAPMAYFPFSGWKESFFGILHGQGKDAVEFYTESKIVVERWSRQETRRF